jgi:xanthine/uracil permease
MLISVDFTNNNNLLIIACSISLGLGATVVPELFAALPDTLRIIVSDGIITGSLTAIILNIVFNMRPKRSLKVISDTKLEPKVKHF